MRRVRWNTVFASTTAIGICAFAYSADAADIRKAPVYKAPIYKAPTPSVSLWEGLYIGAHLGYAWGGLDVVTSTSSSVAGGATSAASGVSSGSGGDGGTGGFQAGYNWQSHNLVYGVEGDLSVAQMTARDTGVAHSVVQGGNPPLFTNSVGEASIDWYGTLRGRLGWAVTNRTLVYATGGFAYGSVRVNNSLAFGGTMGGGPGGSFGLAANTTDSSIKLGWAAGAGVDHALGNNWFLNASYLHIDLGDISAAGATGIAFNAQVAAASSNTTAKLAFDEVRVGASYKIPPSEVSGMDARASTQTAISWAGLYMGAHAGYAWDAPDTATSSATVMTGAANGATSGATASSSGDSGIGGFHAGYNWESRDIVYGVETDLSVARLRARDAGVSTTLNAIGAPNPPPDFTNSVGEASIDWYGTLRGRLGWAVTNRTLVYATGGFAYGSVRVNNSLAFGGTMGGGPGGSFGLAANTTNTSINAGWAAGAGVDHALGNNWFVNASYLHIDLGDISATSATTVAFNASVATATSTTTANLAFDEVRVGASYKIPPF